MTLDVMLGLMLGVIGCVLPFAVGVGVNEIKPDISARALLAVLIGTAAIYWTALIVWLVMR